MPAVAVEASSDGIMAQQEAIAMSKYGALPCKPKQASRQRFDSADFEMSKKQSGGAKMNLLQRTLQGSLLQFHDVVVPSLHTRFHCLLLTRLCLAAEGVKAAKAPLPAEAVGEARSEDAMAQQESIAVSKYGALAPKNAAASMRGRERVKRFDAADFEMANKDGGNI